MSAPRSPLLRRQPLEERDGCPRSVSLAHLIADFARASHQLGVFDHRLDRVSELFGGELPRKRCCPPQRADGVTLATSARASRCSCFDRMERRR